GAGDPVEPREAGARRAGGAGPRAPRRAERGGGPDAPLLGLRGARAGKASSRRRQQPDSGSRSFAARRSPGSDQEEPVIRMEPSRLFGVGISGPVLLPDEREILERFPPWAVILFKRNIQSLEQLRELTRELRELPGTPVLCVDEEGGPVDRFRDLLGPSLSFR